MPRLKVEAYRRTVTQTSIILNVSVRTVQRYLKDGKLKWSGKQVDEESIKIFLNNGKPLAPEPQPQTEEPAQHRSRRPGFVTGWKRRQ